MIEWAKKPSHATVPLKGLSGQTGRPESGTIAKVLIVLVIHRYLFLKSLILIVILLVQSSKQLNTKITFSHYSSEQVLVWIGYLSSYWLMHFI
jgi:hypothetical protein